MSIASVKGQISIINQAEQFLSSNLLKIDLKSYPTFRQSMRSSVLCVILKSIIPD